MVLDGSVFFLEYCCCCEIEFFCSIFFFIELELFIEDNDKFKVFGCFLLVVVRFVLLGEDEDKSKFRAFGCFMSLVVLFVFWVNSEDGFKLFDSLFFVLLTFGWFSRLIVVRDCIFVVFCFVIFVDLFVDMMIWLIW